MVNNLLYIFCIILISSTTEFAQSAKPQWAFDEDDLGYSSIFEEFDAVSKYLIINKNGYLSPMYRNYLYILGNGGEILLNKEIVIDSFDVFWVESHYFSSTNKIMLFGLGTKKTPFNFNEYNHLVTMEVDELGNIGTAKFTKLSGVLGYRNIGFLQDGGGFKLVISTDFAFLDYQELFPNNYETTFIDMSIDGTIKQHHFISTDDPCCQCLLPSTVMEGYQCPGIAGYNLDKNLNFINSEAHRTQRIFETRWPTFFLFREHQKCFLWTNSTYLIVNTSLGSYEDVRSQNTVLFNYAPIDYTLNKYVKIGNGNSSFFLNAMDISSDSMIYTGCNQLSTLTTESVTLEKLNKNLEKIWELNFSKDKRNHTLAGIRCTSDNGFAIYGFRKMTGENNGIPFVIKFDGNGGVSHLDDDINYTFIRSFPNPSSGLFTLDIQGLTTQAEIRIFNIQGKNVFIKHHISDGKTNIDLSMLPDGHYIYKLYNDRKEIGNGQWVKIQ